MRIPRIIILCAFILASFSLVLLKAGSSSSRKQGGSATSVTTEGRFRSLLNFNTPLTLFPPNAIISLTDDNTTSFLARPAAFGPLIPSKGLSGQLWIGSGFGDDGFKQHLGSVAAEGELGCSDVPGWADEDEYDRLDLLSRSQSRASRSSKGMSEGKKDTGHKIPDGWTDPDQNGIDKVPPTVGDRIDDYIRPSTSGSKSGHSSHGLSSNSDHGHTNIQSIQEGTEIAGKVVLLSRGGCGFLEKVKWVQRRGGIALIVGDDTKGGPLIQMYARGDTSNITIPAIFTSHTTAHLLSSLIPSGSSIGASTAGSGQKSTMRSPTRPKNSKKKSEKGKPDLVGAPRPSSKSSPDKGETKKSSVSSLWFGWVSTKSDTSVKKLTEPSEGAKSIENKKLGPVEIDETEDHNFDGQILHVGSEEERKEDHEGLWVTLTQTNGASPFFDTLLVLVVSPLVTLSVVYALLLLRSRIRRRRWRAPKSVVERLPVRTYQTVSSASGSRLPSPTSSSPATPLLQRSEPTFGPQSRTNSVVPEPPNVELFNANSLQQPRAPSQDQDHEKKSNNVTSEWKKYMGKQVECVVCLEEYVDGVSRVMSLPCGHEFHVDCITPWLTTRRRTCPICKGDVVRSLARGSTSSPRYEPYHDDSDDDVQLQAAQSRNDSPTAALPINESEDANLGDPEQGILSPAPSRSQRTQRSGTWRSLLASSLRSTAGQPARGEDEGDRDR